ncbi:MAG: Curli production assembly/transport component CsgG [Bacteroidia bacterium]|nr:Curli production assembly/transport component CsgG [Bacteroidia bacterium]
MRRRKLITIAVLFSCLFYFHIGNAQSKQDPNFQKFENKRTSENLRGKNAFTFSGGSSVMNGDFENPEFDIYFHAGYKRYLGNSVNINLTYHKFNLVYQDLQYEGHMSFDLNVEINLSPFKKFSPYVFVGGGMHASNYFTITEPKVQGGAGFEILISNGLGIKIFGDYNYVFSDEIDGKIYGVSDDVYYRMGLGLNIYFGKYGSRNRISSKEPTVINSNPIVDDY